jgi:OOP family OmpA-OmpF porin
MVFVAGCGGAIQFADNSAIAVDGTPPPPPEPPPEPKRAELKEDRIQINEKVLFAYNQARILEASFPLLNDVAQILKENPHVKRIEVGGHASTEGSDSHNLSLSDRRAKAVVTYLVQKAGIEADRLAGKGYGEAQPLVEPDDTEDKREKNRRVEFIILEQGKKQEVVEAPASADPAGTAATPAP